MSPHMMENTREHKGIIYFIIPPKVNYSDWAFDHLDCDSIIKDDPVNSDDITVLCYAKAKEYNPYLRIVRAEEFPNDIIMGGVDSREVNCID
ncbi:MAG: hypothetical protein IJP92_03155 [Lachnospiraceae bacterium]|nr:hypothetical protein [Lachnospiraceae bacterium]